MKQTLTMTVNNKNYKVEIGDLRNSLIEVSVNGKKYEVALDFGGTSTPDPTPAIPVAQTSPATPAPVQAAKPAPAPIVTGSGGEVQAPMPGTILNIAVKAGDKVSVGQTLCFLEAMKMKNAIKSPREAVIVSIEVTEGQKVSFGEVLVRYT